MSGDDPVVIYAPAETGYVYARLAEDYSRCIRELLGMSVWLPVKGTSGGLIVTRRGDNKLVRAYTAPRRVASIAATDVDPDVALCRGFAELIRRWNRDDLGLVINPDGDTELQLPRGLFPKILKYQEHVRAEERAGLEQRANEEAKEQLAEMKALAARVRNQLDGDVGGNVVQAGAIHGGVHVYVDKTANSAVPVILTTSFGGNASVTVDGEPPTRFPVSGGQEIKILVEGHSAQAVILHELRAVVWSRREPRPVIDGWFAAAALSPRRFRVDLDDDPPQLRPADSVSFPFTVTASDPELFVVTPTSRYEVEWRLELDWTCAGRQGSTVVPGGPFVLAPGR